MLRGGVASHHEGCEAWLFAQALRWVSVARHPASPLFGEARPVVRRRCAIKARHTLGGARRRSCPGANALRVLLGNLLGLPEPAGKAGTVPPRPVGRFECFCAPSHSHFPHSISPSWCPVIGPTPYLSTSVRQVVTMAYESLRWRTFDAFGQKPRRNACWRLLDRASPRWWSGQGICGASCPGQRQSRPSLNATAPRRPHHLVAGWQSRRPAGPD